MSSIVINFLTLPSACECVALLSATGLLSDSGLCQLRLYCRAVLSQAWRIIEPSVIMRSCKRVRDGRMVLHTALLHMGNVWRSHRRAVSPTMSSGIYPPFHSSWTVELEQIVIYVSFKILTNSWFDCGLNCERERDPLQNCRRILSQSAWSSSVFLVFWVMCLLWSIQILSSAYTSTLMRDLWWAYIFLFFCCRLINMVAACNRQGLGEAMSWLPCIKWGYWDL